MPIPVEGVTTEHPAPVTEVAQDAPSVWRPAIRVAALRLALVGPHANMQSEHVVVRAAAFERYILAGVEEPDAPLPTVQEQITQTFINLAGNLDGIA